MVKKRFADEPKPIEQWTAKEWETAYNLLNSKFDRLREKMRLALNALSTAQRHLTEAVV